MKTSALFIFGGLLFVVVVIGLARLGAQWRVAQRIRIDSPNGIDSLEKIRLGGVDQWVQIRGCDKSNPILLFLHGGPGFSEMPFAHLNAALADHFVVVQWDQRGTGKSFARSIQENSMTVNQFVADTHELVQLLLQRFGGAKVVLVAHSWGTIVGARTVARYPELFHVYVALSQVSDPPESEKRTYAFALESAREKGVAKAENELREIGLPPYKTVRDYRTMNRWIHHFNAPLYDEMSTTDFVRLGFASPAYSWTDMLRLWLGFRFSVAHLWREAFYMNLVAEVPRLEVPVYFFLGKHDRTSTASAELAARYFRELDAPQGKELIWFEKSGHWPQLHEPEKYRQLMVEKVLPAIRRSEKTAHD